MTLALVEAERNIKTAAAKMPKNCTPSQKMV